MVQQDRSGFGCLYFKDQLIAFASLIDRKPLVFTSYRALAASTDPVGQEFEFRTLDGTFSAEGTLVANQFDGATDIAILRLFARLSDSVAPIVLSSYEGASSFKGQARYIHDGRVDRSSVTLQVANGKWQLEADVPPDAVWYGSPVETAQGIVGFLLQDSYGTRFLPAQAVADFVPDLALLAPQVAQPQPMKAQRNHARIFLSSTSKDLFDHRNLVRQECTRMGYEMIAMEGFGARDADATDVSLSEVEKADLFIGVYAHRYGHIPPGREQSVTEMEYHHAKALGMPRLFFVIGEGHEDNVRIKKFRDVLDEQDVQTERKPLMDGFLRAVGEDRVWDEFTSPDDLAQRVLEAVSKWEGWRKPQAVVPEQNFIGRAALLAQVKEDLSQPGQRVALVGMGGIGKSITAQNLARELGEHLSGGALWVVLGPEAQNEQEEFRRALVNPRAGASRLAGLEWKERHPQTRLMEANAITPTLLKEAWKDVREEVLVVLDDVWHLEPARYLLSLLPPHFRVLITTRQSDIADRLECQQVINMNAFSEEEGIEFLRDRVGTIPSLAALRRIHRNLGGHPNALEIAAKQIKNNGPDFADELATRLEQIEADGDEADSEIQADMERILRITYDNMPRDLQRRFNVLGAIPPEVTMTTNTIVELWQNSSTEEDDRENSLDRVRALVNLGLLTALEGVDGYTQHSLVRAFAGRRLLEGDFAVPDILNLGFWVSQAKASLERGEDVDLTGMDTMTAEITSQVTQLPREEAMFYAVLLKTIMEQLNIIALQLRLRHNEITTQLDKLSEQKRRAEITKGSAAEPSEVKYEMVEQLYAQQERERKQTHLDRGLELAWNYLQAGEPQKAVRQYEELLNLAYELEDRPAKMVIHTNRTSLVVLLSAPPDASRFIENYSEIAAQLNALWMRNYAGILPHIRTNPHHAIYVTSSLVKQLDDIEHLLSQHGRTQRQHVMQSISFRAQLQGVVQMIQNNQLQQYLVRLYGQDTILQLVNEIGFAFNRPKETSEALTRAITTAAEWNDRPGALSMLRRLSWNANEEADLASNAFWRMAMYAAADQAAMAQLTEAEFQQRLNALKAAQADRLLSLQYAIYKGADDVNDQYQAFIQTNAEGHAQIEAFIQKLTQMFPAQTFSFGNNGTNGA